MTNLQKLLALPKEYRNIPWIKDLDEVDVYMTKRGEVLARLLEEKDPETVAFIESYCLCLLDGQKQWVELNQLARSEMPSHTAESLLIDVIEELISQTHKKA